MSAGRKWLKEFYVGFLLFLLTFLYLSHLTESQRFQVESGAEISRTLLAEATVVVANNEKEFN